MPEWVDHSFALIHGDDRDERQRNMGAWKARHTDPAWGEFGLRVCSETATWADIYQALHEPPPLGAETVAVIAPSLGELLMKKDIPEAMLRLLQAPPPHLRFLGVAMGTVTEAKGKGLGRAPWTQWNQKGQVLKVGVLAPKDAPSFAQQLATSLGLKLPMDAAQLLIQQVGPHPARIRRTLEVLDVACATRTVSIQDVQHLTFRLEASSGFAWSKAWKSGQVAVALDALQKALEDKEEPVKLLGQARLEVERIARYLQAQAQRIPPNDLLDFLGFTPRQAFLLDDIRRVGSKLRPQDVQALLHKVSQCDRDIKGLTFTGARTPLLDLTLALSRAWAR